MASFEIPTAPFPQRYPISLSGVTYVLCFQFRSPGAFGAEDGVWVLDIADRAGVPLACGLPLIPGVNLLAQYDYLGFGGAMVVETDGKPDQPPTYTGLGVQSRLYWVTRE